MKVFIASHNNAKIARYKELLKYIDQKIEAFSPKDLNIPAIDVLENGKTLAENAKLKSMAYFGKVDMPIISNDTGVYVAGEGFVDAPKRMALGEVAEETLSKEEISEKLSNFWKGIATKYGGKVDAAWVEAFFVVYPNGETKKAESRREIILTNQEFGTPHVEMPLRALYYSKITNKPSLEHTKEEEILEMQPVIEALKKVLGY